MGHHEAGTGGNVRTIVKLAYAAGVLVMVGCSAGDRAMNDDLKKDLELAWSSDAITLAGSDQNASRQVVSAIERDQLPAPRKIAPSRRVAKHHPAPRTPKPVEIEKAEVTNEVGSAPVEVAPAPSEPAPAEVASLPSPRPQPVAVGDDIGVDRGDRGIDRGRVLGGIITVVLRGGGVDGDNCDEHMRGGRGGRGRTGAMIAINNRIPIQTTFPGRRGF
ncbi:MAG: hypothetical protein ABIZ73_09015 [Gemmatimonadaceae bacterium]